VAERQTERKKETESMIMGASFFYEGKPPTYLQINKQKERKESQKSEEKNLVRLNLPHGESCC
jgi:hypothetical protein